MTDQFEAELRQAFALRAAEVPADALERLRRVDYRPRTGGRWPLTVSAVTTTLAVAVVTSVVILARSQVVDPGRSQAAFVGWTATPITTTDQSSTAQGGCQVQLATVPGGSSQGGWSELATDLRGPYTMTAYESDSSLASCFTGPSFTTVQVESLNAADGGMAVSVSGTNSPPASPSNMVRSSNMVRLLSGGDIEQLLVSHLSQAGNGPYTLVEGRLEPTVSAATLVLSNGQVVTATTGSGWLVAWWPGDQDVTAAQVTSAGGTTTEPLNASSFTPPPPPTNGSSPPIHGSPRGGSPAPLSPLGTTQ